MLDAPGPRRLAAVRPLAVFAAAGLGFGFRDPSALELLGGHARQVRLDVEDGTPVEHVDAANGEAVVVPLDEAHHGERNRIGAPRGAGGEDTVRTVGGRRFADELVVGRAIGRPRSRTGARSPRCRGAPRPSPGGSRACLRFVCLAPMPFEICLVSENGVRTKPMGSHGECRKRHPSPPIERRERTRPRRS